MARSASADPIEKFRFRITVISIDNTLSSAVESVAAISAQGTFLKNKAAVFSRAGFSAITLPKPNVTEISYRENIDNLRFTKIPGLVRHEPITLSRGVAYTLSGPTISGAGVASNRDLYEWYRLVNEELALLSVAGELSRNTVFTPTQSNTFRKDVIIEVLDREGNSIKGWYLFNAWPISYQPGNDLNASSDEKLIESLTLTYEYFLELDGGINGLLKELEKGLVTLAANAGLNSLGI